METDLKQYKVKFRVSWDGLNPKQEKRLINDYLDELRHRTVIKNVVVISSQPGNVDLEIDTVTWPADSEKVKGHYEEELLEALSAVIPGGHKKCRVEALEIKEFKQ